MIVNISDAIAMNASPKYALYFYSNLNNYTQEDLKALVSGFNPLQRV